jgi:hypothetical protein
MLEKGITTVVPTATEAYLAWKRPRRKHDPMLSPESTRIPDLRRTLFSLPAETNYSDYHKHVFEVLAALRTKLKCAAEKHIEDKSYADMRLNLKSSVPTLQARLKRLVAVQVEKLVIRPWHKSARKSILHSIKSTIRERWADPDIRYHGFQKMIREYGIPVNGVYEGRNLNDDLLGSFKTHLKRWDNKMQSHAEQLAEMLGEPAGQLITNIELEIAKSSAGDALKSSAADALEDASRRVDTANEELLDELTKSLRTIYVQFTTEIDMHCPIALEMAPAYNQAKDIVGKGAYDKKRKSIIKSIESKSNRSDDSARPLIKAIEKKLVKQQKDVWTEHCNAYIEEVIGHLDEFSDITEELLEDEANATEAHKNAQAEIKTLLANFDKGLGEIQGRFTSEAVGPLRKKAKLGQSDEDIFFDLVASEKDMQGAPVLLTLVGDSEHRRRNGMHPIVFV